METNASIEYDFVAPRQIAFGWGRRHGAGKLALSVGTRAFVICGSRTLAGNGRLDEILQAVQAAGVEVIGREMICREPEVEDVDRVAGGIRGSGLAPGTFLLAVGGGSAIDLAKAAAAMATNEESPTVKNYLEGVGSGLKIVKDPLPVMAIPTTAGAGAEVTKNAVVSSYDPPFKRSLRDNRMVPLLALLDPELTVSAPPDITAASGMDAITQLIESYISRKACPIPQAVAVQGLRMAIAALPEAVRNPTSRPAREKMAHAAMLSGMALANSGLGLAHGIAPALGVVGRVPHGKACALMLPVALRVNQQAAEHRLAQLARWVFENHAARSSRQAADFFVGKIEELCDSLGLPRRLSEVGIQHDQITQVVAARSGSSMSGNPKELSEHELRSILESIL